MNCPNCKEEMEKGYLAVPGEMGVVWQSEKSFLKAEDLTAWLCSKCGKVELISELKK